jgi:hypothetical protein
MTKKLLFLLVLLLTATTGAWAQEPTTYSVKLNDGNKDAANWTIASGSSSVKGNVGDGLTGLKENDAVTVTYTGTRKVLGMKVAKKGGAAGNAYLKWNADQKKLVATDIPATVTNVTNADTNVEWAAGTYVVEGDVTINGTITLNGDVDLIIKDGAKLTVNNDIDGSDKNLSIYGQANKTGQLVVYCSSFDAICGITTLEVHSCQVTANSSGGGCGSFSDIDTFNVYGGSVDAEYTGTSGYGIGLADNGSMNIYGGDVKAVGKSDGDEAGIKGTSVTVTVYGGRLWAEDAGNKALYNGVTLAKGAGFTGKIKTSSDGSSWTDWTTEGTPNTKYVKAE